ncbi:DHA2 family efflux MFS transporter permease subunit [Pleurocapsa sp. FMAR1]|uniref:DHA2 family efflux MFS transporter permease subunit n=1 Tax=Pleurocapsa sp. FMAR1 TaxID=3040204 RepID=UPI0029C9221C|nr:DHA2 family efflux MFS transporter permease subunit [Pleurocapsa sp. FMAR1]
MTQINKSQNFVTDRLDTNFLKWAIAITVALGAILEVIDTSIVNVALPDIQANLGATITEIGWVVTGYAIANVIVIPLTAWLGEQFGQKRYFIFSLVGFTISSVLCGFAPTLPFLIISRILQGLCGGGLLAKAQAILFQTFPPEEQGTAQGVFGMGVIVGPAIGPTLGGYLTDSVGWRWIFFVNIPKGILAVIMCWLFLPTDSKATQHSSRKVDWLGISLLAIAVGSLQTFLEEGERDDWFNSSFIFTLGIVAVLVLGLFIWRELTAKRPAVDLKVLRHRSLAAGSLYSAILGMGLYGTLFAVPIFAQNVLHFTAMQTGMLLFPGALAAGIMMPILGKVTSKIDSRLLIASGAIITSLVMFQLAKINSNTGTEALFYPLLWRGVGTVLMFLPLSLATIGSLPKSDIPAGSGFYNLTRQLGGSIGIAILSTLLARREAFHRAILSSDVSLYNSATNQRLDALTGAFQGRGMDAHTAHQQALAVISQTLDLQSSILSFEDIFKIVGIVFICTLPLLLLLGKGNKKASVSGVD